MLQAAGAAALLGTAPLGRLVAGDKKATKRLLFFTKSSGFEHSVIKRGGDKLSHAEQILTDIGKQHGFEVVCSKDGRLFDPEKIGQWDAFAFETTGDLTKPGTDKNPPISADGEKVLYDVVHGGKGFLGMHCATDTFGYHRGKGADDPYIQMIGAEFIGHGAQQTAKIDVADPKFPGVGRFGDSFEILDEWYALKHSQDNLRVVLVQNTKDMDKSRNNKVYDRPNFPETWARMHGKGRVFYTSMGHREDVWSNAKYQGLLIGALLWATGQVDADVTPNINKVTPGYQEHPK